MIKSEDFNEKKVHASLRKLINIFKQKDLEIDNLEFKEIIEVNQDILSYPEDKTIKEIKEIIAEGNKVNELNREFNSNLYLEKKQLKINLNHNIGIETLKFIRYELEMTEDEYNLFTNRPLFRNIVDTIVLSSSPIAKKSRKLLNLGLFFKKEINIIRNIKELNSDISILYYNIDTYYFTKVIQPKDKETIARELGITYPVNPVEIVLGCYEDTTLMELSKMFSDYNDGLIELENKVQESRVTYENKVQDELSIRRNIIDKYIKFFTIKYSISSKDLLILLRLYNPKFYRDRYNTDFGFNCNEIRKMFKYIDSRISEIIELNYFK